MSTAGDTTKIRFRTSSGIGTGSDNVDGVQESSFNRVREELETTDFKSGVARTYILGLSGAEIPFSGDYESADTPYGRAETAFGDGSDLWVVWLPDGSAGWMFATKVTKLEIASKFDGKVTISGTLRMTGAVAAAA